MRGLRLAHRLNHLGRKKEEYQVFSLEPIHFLHTNSFIHISTF